MKPSPTTGRRCGPGPDFARAHSNLGAALMARGNTDEAITHFRLAVQLDPDSPQAHGNLATALMLNGKPDEGIAQYRQALRIDPAFAEGHLNLAIALAQHGKQGRGDHAPSGGGAAQSPDGRSPA